MLPVYKYDRPTSSVLAAHHAPRLQVSTIAPHLAYSLPIMLPSTSKYDRPTSSVLTAHHAPRLQVSTIAPHLAYSLPIMLPVYK